MEGRTDINLARRILDKNFIGVDDLRCINEKMKLNLSDFRSSFVPFDENTLRRNKDNGILIWGCKLGFDNRPYTLNFMRDLFGMDPNKSEPCFYNQDWYVNELFASQTTLDNKWYFINKTILPSTRGKVPTDGDTKLPSAILTAYAFFANYFLNKDRLWNYDYVWCCDTDNNGDMIYTGRYEDFNQINKNGFSIHRHLKIRDFYGTVSVID